MTTPIETFCARHPSTPTVLRCGRCGTPICPRCLVATPLGQRCPACGQGNRLPTFQVSAGTLARGATAGLLVATALAYLWSRLPGFAFWLGLLVGFTTGEAVAWATNRKRGRALMVTAALAVVVGFVLGYATLGRVGGLASVLNPLFLRRDLLTLVALALAATIAALRQRG